MSPPGLLTFDCYGTLIDWHGGLRRTIANLVGAHADPDRLAKRYVVVEAEMERGPYRSYRDVMATALEQTLDEAGITVPSNSRDLLAEALPGWEPFPEVPGVLAALQDHLPLAILSNIDDDLLDASVAKLGVPIAHRVTAQGVGSYKPAPAHFHRIQQLTGRAGTEILHIAASLHHDIEPTRELGIPHVWVNRREEPIPDWLAKERVLPDLRSLPELVSRKGSMPGL